MRFQRSAVAANHDSGLAIEASDSPIIKLGCKGGSKSAGRRWEILLVYGLEGCKVIESGFHLR